MSNSVELDFHRGSTLMRLSGVYPTVQQAVEEIVQNCLDAKAPRIEIRVNQKTGTIAVFDNGDGISQKKFHQEVSKSIGQSIKSKGQLGQFGIGLIAPIGKCEAYTVTSCVSPKKGPYTQWTMNAKDMARQSKELHIPETERGDYVFAVKASSTQGPKVWWRTAAIMRKVTRDKTVSRMSMESLSHGLLEKYSRAMRKHGTKIHVTFIDEKGNEGKTILTPSTYTGKRLPVVEIVESAVGKVRCELYLTKAKRSPGRRINICFGEAENDFRVTWQQMMTSHARDLFSEEAIEALKSGIFEGEFVAERINLNPQRTFFEKDDYLVGLVIAVETWLAEHGAAHLDQESKVRSQERYQNLGRRSMDRLERLFKEGETADLLAQAKTHFKKGSIGEGHADPTTGRLGGVESEKALASSRPKSKDEVGEGKKYSKTKAKKEHPAHTPTTVKGPLGGKRTSVRGNSIGFHFAFDDLEGSNSLWEIDLSTGTLIFNITHPLWVECEVKDWMVCTLMEKVSIQALTLVTMLDLEYYHQVRLQMDREIAATVCWLKSGGVSIRLR